MFSCCPGQMRSLRIFYSDDACTNGQLVIASRESQYKILHFHHGGLDHIAETFADWKFLAQPKRKVTALCSGMCILSVQTIDILYINNYLCTQLTVCNADIP